MPPNRHSRFSKARADAQSESFGSGRYIEIKTHIYIYIYILRNRRDVPEKSRRGWKL